MYRQRFPDDPGMHHNPDMYTRVTYAPRPTFMQRVKESLLLVIVGCILLCASVGIQLWNEGRAVQTAKSLNEGMDALQVLQSASTIVRDADEHLVYVNGHLSTDKELVDEDFEIRTLAVRLRRVVEMYQWIEHRRERKQEVNGEIETETTYSYTQEWQKGVVDSRHFNSPHIHHNPVPAIKDREYVAMDVTVGAFHLSSDLVEKIVSYQRLSLTKDPTNPRMKLKNNYYYYDCDPSYPQIGAIRVYFEFAGSAENRFLNKDSSSAEEVSIIAKQYNDRLVPYETQSGHSIALLYSGHHAPFAMFESERRANTALTWGLRMLGWLIAFFGFSALTNVVITLTDWIPLLRDVVRYGLHTLNIFLSLGLSLATIAIGWIFYRPLVGGLVLFIVIMPFFWSRYRRPRSYD